MIRAGGRDGALAIVLHTHMPYVEGFGTWPFGEEWLWEAVATCYLPLLDALDAAPGRVTLSVTPVLGDQLEAPGALERCAAFLREIRPESHRLDLAATRDVGERAALEHSARTYERAVDALERGGLQERLAAHAAWTRSSRCWRRSAACGCSWRPASRPTGHGRASGAAACGCPSARTRRGSTRCSRRPGCGRHAST
jgi:hypothetical protein